MRMRRGIWWSVISGLVLGVACGEQAAGPEASVAPSFSAGGVGRPSVLVNPNANGNGTARTIQEGIDMVGPGGTVMVVPGTYTEALMIDKGLTLEGIGGESGPVVIKSPPGLPTATIEVATANPVIMDDLTVLVRGQNGILAQGVFDLTLERLTMVFEEVPPTGTNRLVRPVNNASQTGARARLVVRESFFDAKGLPSTLAISIAADIDAVIEGNVVRRTRASCIFFNGQSPGRVTLDVVGNDLDECATGNPNSSAIEVGPIVTGTAQATVGIVNIVGNTIRNSNASCTPSTAIRFELYTGRIERNSIIGVVQECATPSPLALPAAIWVGSLRGLNAASPVVRFNDIVGNAFAGLRVGPNITTSLDARCNWWGSANGPSGVGTGTGDAVIVETGAARPVLTPFATESVARAESCHLEFSLWSEAVNLGAVVNSSSNDHAPALSEDQLTLYFSSDRLGGFGGPDIWVSQRACGSCPWGSPVNLGAVVNTAASEFRPSVRGSLLFFQSDRTGGQGATDIWRSRRVDPQDPFGWESPENAGTDVNTPAPEQVPNYVPVGPDGVGSLCFTRGPATVGQDIYCASVAPDGRTLGPAAVVSELNDPTVNDASPALRGDGLEIIFHSPRIGALGLADLWASTRRFIDDPWSIPFNLGAPPNTAFLENRPFLSADGRTLVFDSSRPGFGAGDLWISTRTRIGDGER